MTTTQQAATEAQVLFITRLVAERFSEDSLEFGAWNLWIAKASKVGASKAIEGLKALPKIKTEAKPHVDDSIQTISARIPVSDTQTETYFAFESGDVVKFYKLSRPTEGNWAGRIFLDAQASDGFFPIKNSQTKTEILTQLADNYEAAVTLYGKKLKRCGICHRSLTDTESRNRGIGPDCAKKVDL